MIGREQTHLFVFPPPRDFLSSLIFENGYHF